MKKQDQSSEKGLNKMKISNVQHKVFKVIVINMLSELERGIDEFRVSARGRNFFLKSKVKNTITEMKNTLEGINSRSKNAEEQSSGLENSVVEISQLA